MDENKDLKKYQVVIKQSRRYGETVTFDCSSIGQAIGMFQVLANANEPDTEIRLVTYLPSEEEGDDD